MKITKITSLPQKGFTLIELLVVIAVIGVLAAVVIVAIDPVEQINRGKDAGLKSTIGEMGRGMMSYGVSHNNLYKDYAAGNTTFIADLKSAGELKVLPTSSVALPGNSCRATTNDVSQQNNFCYISDATFTEFLIYGVPVSKSLKASCATTETAFYVYSSADGRAGLVCKTTAGLVELTPGTQSFVVGM